MISKPRISIPGVRGVFTLDVGPTTWEAHVRSDGKETQLRAMGRPDNLLITAFLQKVEFPASAEECRAQWWPGAAKNMSFKREEAHQSEKDGIALVEYVIPEVEGLPVHQKNVHAYLGGHDLCAEVHLSKVSFVPGDQKLFDEVLATLRLLPEDVALEGQSREDRDRYFYFVEASLSFKRQNYAEAARRYQKLFDLEKQRQTLSRSYFRVLMDNMGMSYGISGNLAKAVEIFEYGLTQDPEYPMYYYNLACAYGEMGKMDESLGQLRLAYKYKSNVIPGESLPDPLKDDSFRMFVKDKKFLDALREMQRP